MKKSLLLCCCIILMSLLSSCQPQTNTPIQHINSDPDAFRMDMDYRYMDGTNMQFIETKDMLYSISGSSIYCSAKENPEWLPLCAKPECLHNDESCNAYAGWGIGIGCFNGNIYYIGSQTDTLKGEISSYNYLGMTKMDGSGHSEVCKLNYSSASTFQCRIHRGIFYCIEAENAVWTSDGTDTYEPKTPKYSIQMLNLSDLNPKLVLLAEGEGECIALGAFGNTVYFQCYDSEANSDIYTHHICENKLEKLPFKIQGGILYADSHFIYTGSSSQGYIWRYDRNTGEEELLVSFGDKIDLSSWKNYPMILSDGTYLYCISQNEGILFICDMEGNNIGETVFPPSQSVIPYITSEKIFITWMAGSTSIWKGYFKYSDIGNESILFYSFE